LVHKSIRNENCIRKEIAKRLGEKEDKDGGVDIKEKFGKKNGQGGEKGAQGERLHDKTCEKIISRLNGTPVSKSKYRIHNLRLRQI
jgi:hypothetical protein